MTVWQDTRTLRLGQKWTFEIEDGIRSAAAFLAIVSPSYLRSQWCRRESEIALEKTLEALKIQSFYRFLKIIKTPGPDQAHEEFLEGLQDKRFFSEADGYELPTDSAEFTAVIRACSRQIRELLTLMSNQGQEVYLAPGALDMHKEREELERELKDHGLVDATYQSKNSSTLAAAVRNGNRARYLVRLSKDLRLLNLSGYEFAAQRLDEIGRMTGGWWKSAKTANGSN